MALCNLLSMEVGQEEVFVARHGLLLLLIATDFGAPPPALRVKG